MPTGRLEAFSDGVLAIIITIMVLELRVPEGHDLHAFTSGVGTSLLTYLLSFVYIGIYWNNHHHMLHATTRVTGGILWANLHLLFWLSLFPFTTAWMDESDFARTPLVVYGVNLCAAAIAYFIMQSLIIRTQGVDSTLRRAVGADAKGKLSPVCYLAGIGCAFGGGDHANAWTYTGLAFFVAVAVMWLVPDRRIERSVAAGADHAVSSRIPPIGGGSFHVFLMMPAAWLERADRHLHHTRIDVRARHNAVVLHRVSDDRQGHFGASRVGSPRWTPTTASACRARRRGPRPNT